MRSLFHIVNRQVWQNARAAGNYEPESLNQTGFIHLCRAHQIAGVLDRFFKNERELALLHIDQDLLAGEVKEEIADGDNFPHLYGPLNPRAVVAEWSIGDKSGGHVLPTELRIKNTILIRRALPGDEAEIANVHVHSWQQSYVGLVPENVLAAQPKSFARRMRRWRFALSPGAPGAVFVAETPSNGVVGFCSVEPARDSEFAGCGEITAIYLLNSHKREGVGAELFRAGQDWLAHAGFRRQYLWVLRDNPTIRFYLKMGGQKCGQSREVQIGKKLATTAFAFEVTP